MQIKHWLLAVRPKTLGISVVPVLVGTALAWAELNSVIWLPALAALIAAILIQIGTNLYNDAADFERGADTPDRLGPKRATAQGWFSAAQVKRAALISFGSAFLIGIYLAWVGGWPIILIGLLSLLAGYAYTGGPRPIAYSASGEVFVFIFFGLMAVSGSYYLQTSSLTAETLICAGAIGLLAAAVLLVNNYRDLETDERAAKLTLTHYLGRERARQLYILLMLLPFALPVAFNHRYDGSWLVVLCLPFALWLLHRFSTEPPGRGFNDILANTAKLQLVYGALLSLGLIL
ncbi:MAG: 1,4-dihydroxy-2-naphthoate polyprenyltransferase [Sedimenticola sp.]|nr:1,4-dihydroxy-2-naphthoate polyprenyltransferase [Sedimenticola sp.]